MEERKTEEGKREAWKRDNGGKEDARRGAD